MVVRPNVDVPAFVAMPNHVHALVVIHEPTNAANPTDDTDHITNANPTDDADHITNANRIRTQRAYDYIVRYVHTNPQRWKSDMLYSFT